MKVNWVVWAEPTRTADGALSSDVASIRYRVLTPARGMKRDGDEHRLIALTPGGPASRREAVLDCDVAVFSKSFDPANAELAERAKAAGVLIIFDVCDPYFHHPQDGPLYRRLAAIAHQVVCNSPEMATIAAPFAQSSPVVIEDPYEGPRGAPRFDPGARLKLLWFGHPTNLDSLQAALGDLVRFGERHPIDLLVLTQAVDGLPKFCAKVNASLPDRRLMMGHRSWSLEAQAAALAACDAVVIPNLSTPHKVAKSANRGVTALWAGRPAVAQPLPAYQDLAAWLPVRPTLSEGLAWLLERRPEVPAVIAAGQDYIETRYSPARVSGQWAEVIRAQYQQRATGA